MVKRRKFEGKVLNESKACFLSKDYSLKLSCNQPSFVDIFIKVIKELHQLRAPTSMTEEDLHYLLNWEDRFVLPFICS